jgi:hypothetical protein
VSPDNVLEPVSGSTGSCSSCFSFLDGVSAAFFLFSVTGVAGATAGGDTADGDAAAAGVVEGCDSAGVLSVEGGGCAVTGVDDAGGSGVVAGDGAVCPYSCGERVKAKTPAAIIAGGEKWHVGLNSTADYPVIRPTAIPTMQSAIAAVDAHPSQ